MQKSTRNEIQRTVHYSLTLWIAPPASSLLLIQRLFIHLILFIVLPIIGLSALPHPPLHQPDSRKRQEFGWNHSTNHDKLHWRAGINLKFRMNPPVPSIKAKNSFKFLAKFILFLSWILSPLSADITSLLCILCIRRTAIKDDCVLNARAPQTEMNMPTVIAFSHAAAAWHSASNKENISSSPGQKSCIVLKNCK